MAKLAQKVAEGAARYVTAEAQGAELLLQNLDVWTAATRTKSTSGRGSGGKIELAGIKKLRELILELAVRGKLVPQDPRDEPAVRLLGPVQQEREALVNCGKIKKQKKTELIGKEDHIYAPPKGWEWVRLGDISLQITDGVHHTPKYLDSGVPFISVKDINGVEVLLDNCKFISEEQHREINARCNPEHGDLLICRIGTLGRVTPVNISVPFSLFVSVGLIKVPRAFELTSYLHKVMNSPVLERQYHEVKAGGSHTNKLNLGDIPNLLIPLPPLEEQQRIVAKVDELMTLCDQLEQQTEQQLEAHQQLVETLLGTLTQSQSADELAANWQRLAEHFDLLFSGPMGEWAVDRLKDTILQLAVMGKLVPQDPNDEPASVLLERTQQEKARLIAEGKIKKQKPLPPISEEEKPFELPEGWAFGRVGELVSKLGSGSTPRGGKSAYVSEGIPFLRSQNVWNDGLVLDDIAYISSDTHTRMGNTVVYPGDLLLNITGASLGRSIIFPDVYPEANVSQHVTIIRFLEPQMTPFMWLCVRSPLVQSLVWGRQVGMAIEGLSKKVLERFEMPVPPLAEQRRIVDKVGSLFDLCDSLKLKIRAVGETELSLCDVLVEKALTH